MKVDKVDLACELDYWYLGLILDHALDYSWRVYTIVHYCAVHL